MKNHRDYRRFAHHEACFVVCCDRFDVVASEIVRQRAILDGYIRSHPAFRTALAPLRARPGAPEVARRMVRAAESAGVGPMAAVAGAMAQLAAEAALAAGAEEAIVDNGGDIYIRAVAPVEVGIYSGEGGLKDRLAFAVSPENTPIAICSSSGVMGHSFSEGKCDLATVVARDAALADAAATRAANLVTAGADVRGALDRAAAIPGVEGALIVMGAEVGLVGRLPPLVRNLAKSIQAPPP